jgi:hypothetical protein
MIIVVNHELTASVGIVRAHGEPGAFVSKLIVDRDTFEVVSVIQEMSVVSSRALNRTHRYVLLCTTAFEYRSM